MAKTKIHLQNSGYRFFGELPDQVASEIIQKYRLRQIAPGGLVRYCKEKPTPVPIKYLLKKLPLLNKTFSTDLTESQIKGLRSEPRPTEQKSVYREYLSKALSLNLQNFAHKELSRGLADFLQNYRIRKFKMKWNSDKMFQKSFEIDLA